VLYDCHSIRSEIPHLFDDQLPDFNIGNNEGRTCSYDIIAAAENVCAKAPGFTHIVNGRFKGGWTTRHYGQPENGVHAIQMEIAQRTYLESEVPPFAYARAKAEVLRTVLRNVLQAILATTQNNEFSASIQENQRG
jgi:formiminoglutamase